MNIISETATHKTESVGVISDAQSKQVKWSTFESELPNSVSIELESIYKRTTSKSKGVLKAVIELRNDMNSDKTFDAFGADISTLLSQMVNHTALTQAQSGDILTALQS